MKNSIIGKPVTMTELQKLKTQASSALRKKKYSTETVSVATAYQFKGDFSGLLHELNLFGNDNLLTLFLNGLSSSSEYDGINTIILLPTLTSR